MKAIFSLNSDEIFIQTGPEDARLPKEQWDKMKSEMNFRWFPGSKQFVAKWTPYVEDYVTGTLGLEIDDEFRADDPERRIDRYEKYAEDATESAERALDRADDVSDKKSEALKNKSVSETERAAYWRSRAEGAIARAMQKEDPGVIYRRINGPEGFAKRLRGHLKDQNEQGMWVGVWQIVDSYEMALFNANRSSLYMGGTSIYSQLCGNTITWEKAKELCVAAHERSMTFHTRWIEHLQMVMDYNQALYLASGGIAADASKPEAGGAVICYRSRNKEDWLPISKVNKITVEVVSQESRYTKESNFREAKIVDCYGKLKLADIKKIMSKAEFEQWKADGTLPERYQKKVENA